MNYALRNPPRVYRQQHAGCPATYRAERTAENSQTRTSGGAGPPPQRTTPAVRSPAVEP
jgi:hypothetical protein